MNTQEMQLLCEKTKVSLIPNRISVLKKNQSTRPRNPNSIDIPVIRQAPGDLIIPALLDLVENRIARPQVDPVLRCQMRDARGLIQLRVNQILRCLEFHQHRQTSFRCRVVPRVRARSGRQRPADTPSRARCPGS